MRRFAPIQALLLLKRTKHAYLHFVLFVCFPSKYKPNKVQSKYGTNGGKNHKVTTLCQIAKLGPDFVKVNGIRCNEEISTESRKMSTETVKISDHRLRPNLWKNEQIDVSFSCVCPVVGHEFRHNIVKVAVDPRGDSQVDPQTTLTML